MTPIAEETTPASLGYRMPAEWEPHQSTWIAWPRNRSDWPGKFDPIPWVYAEIVRHLGRAERVDIVVNNAAVKASARMVLKHAGVGLKNIRFHQWPTNRVWTRDSGPIFVRRTSGPDSIAATHWRFNAWAKYPDWKLDSQLPDRITRKLRLKRFAPFVNVQDKRRHVVLEGGSIDVNGRGLMLTTEECLLSNVQARNPGMSRRDLEGVFAAYLGIKKVIWLAKGIIGDDTHGHVDDIARFVAPGTIMIAMERDRRDANYALLKENRRRLEAATDLEGRRFQIIDLPLPRPVIFRRQRLPASYANFYVANGLVLVPTFNDPQDRVALNLLAGAFPDREVVGIYCGDFIWGLGAIHCMTQQQPA
jgi:agmatine deiminase